MLRRWLPAVILVCCADAAVLRAQDEVHVKGNEKPIKGTIKAESPKEIQVGLKNFIPATDVIDIVYDLSEREKTPVSNIQYRAAAKKERESLDPAQEPKRKENLAEALKKYEEVLPTVADKAYKRHIEYKIAMLRVRQVNEDGEPADKVIPRLKDYAKKNPAGWQISHVYQTLGRLQIDTGDYAGAQETYTQLAKVDGLPDDVRQDAKLLTVQTMIQAGDVAGARSAIAELQKELPPKSRYYSRAQVAEAECLVAEAAQLKTKDAAGSAALFEKAIGMVRGVIKDASDRYVKAVGHNTLGVSYLEQGKTKDAMWEFLWVDVVYNQDRVQHAKALYWLWDIATKDGDATRAQEFRELLLSAPYNGTSWQQKLQKDNKAG